jgi:hypothetical protein
MRSPRIHNFLSRACMPTVPPPSPGEDSAIRGGIPQYREHSVHNIPGMRCTPACDGGHSFGHSNLTALRNASPKIFWIRPCPWSPLRGIQTGGGNSCTPPGPDEQIEFCSIGVARPCDTHATARFLSRIRWGLIVITAWMSAHGYGCRQPLMHCIALHRRAAQLWAAVLCYASSAQCCAPWMPSRFAAAVRS